MRVQPRWWSREVDGDEVTCLKCSAKITRYHLTMRDHERDCK